jgi:hypothetical protein
MMRIALLIALLTSFITFDPLPKLRWQDEAKKAERAQELLKQARTAIGSDKVKSLSIVGSHRQKMGENEVSGDLELMMLLPDKFLKSTVTSPIANIEITRMEALNGDTVWTDLQNNAPAGGNFVFRTAGGPTASPEQQKAQQNFIRQEWTRLLLGMLGQAPTMVQLDCTYAGEAEAPDGVADVIDVKGKAIGLTAQLFLDQKTHRPLMLSYQGRKTSGMRMVTRQISHGEGEKKKTPEELEKEAKEMQAKAQAAAAAEPLVEIQLRFEEYRSEDGITLPHRISRTVDGQMTEEWQLTKFKINPTIKADKFEKK